MTITELVEQSHNLAKEKGWHDVPRSPLEALCLIHSEISEACEEVRAGRPLDKTLVTEFLDSRTAKCRLHDRSDGPELKPFGFPIELADAVIRIADLCGELGIDLEEAIRVKHEYNKTRPYRHGKKV